MHSTAFVGFDSSVVIRAELIMATPELSTLEKVITKEKTHETLLIHELIPRLS